MRAVSLAFDDLTFTTTAPALWLSEVDILQITEGLLTGTLRRLSASSLPLGLPLVI